MKELITKQIKNIQLVFDDLFNKLKTKIITLDKFIELRDNVNLEKNEALYSWHRSGTGRWALGFGPDKKIRFGRTRTNNDDSFSVIEIDEIITNRYNRDLAQIILKINSEDIETFIKKVITDIIEIKEIVINIENFKIPQYNILFEIEWSDD